MKKLTRLFALMAVLGVLSCCLMACGDDGNKDETPTEPATQEATEEATFYTLPY